MPYNQSKCANAAAVAAAGAALLFLPTAVAAAPPLCRSVPFRYGLLHKIFLTASVEIAMREVLGVSPDRRRSEKLEPSTVGEKLNGGGKEEFILWRGDRRFTPR